MIDETELQELLKARGIELDIKELAKEARSLKQVKEESPNPAVSKSENGFSLSMVNYPDFAISKLTPTMTKTIVIMPSTDSYYLKSVPVHHPEKQEVIELTSDLYASFTSGMPDFELPDDFWIKTISRGKKFYDSLRWFVKTPHVTEMIRFRLIKYDDSTYGVNKLTSVYEELGSYMKKFRDNKKVMDLLTENPGVVMDIERTFGVNNTVDFLNEYTISLMYLTSTNYHQHFRNGYLKNEIRDGRFTDFALPLPGIPMEYARFKEYVLYDAVRYGYGRNAYTFFNEWNDSLEMQIEYYGKIREKYPEALQTYHAKLAYIALLHREEIDAKKFMNQSRKAQALEWSSNGYVFIAPKTKDDFYDEASQQANCLASYIDRFANGESMIMFLRKKDTPDTSLVTIEIDVDNLKIRQAYRARNKKISDEEENMIHRWLTHLANQKKAA